jgi:hypothetical protein
MTAEEVLAAYGSRARRATVALEGMKDPVVQVTGSEGRLLLTADLQDGRVFRIHVHRPALATEKGARVGTRLRALEKQYGRGQALVGEGVVCVVFPRAAPGRSFCLADAYRLITDGRPPGWDRLREADPPVETILVVGSAVEAGSAPAD